MSVAEEFPPFVTVLKSREKFYAAIMEWDGQQERYGLSRNRPAGHPHRISTDAKIDAQSMAQKLGVEYRDA